MHHPQLWIVACYALLVCGLWALSFVVPSWSWFIIVAFAVCILTLVTWRIVGDSKVLGEIPKMISSPYIVELCSAPEKYLAIWLGIVFCFIAYVVLIGLRLTGTTVANGDDFPGHSLQRGWTNVVIWLEVGFIFSLIISWLLLRFVFFDPGRIEPSYVDFMEMSKEVVKVCHPPNVSKFCYTCLIRRPLRSKHCTLCGICIARMDHHCIWLNSCIGDFNHRQFILFLVFHALTSIVWSVLSILAWSREIPNDSSSGGSNACQAVQDIFSTDYFPTLVLGILAMLSSIMLVALLCDQLRNIAQNITTNEKLNWKRYLWLRTSANGTPNLVDHILLAEFDVDTGSTVRYKYPGPVPGYSDDFFANFMLPEGAHNHALDWTITFLNQHQAPLGAKMDDSVDWVVEQQHPIEKNDDKDTKSGPFLYCINLVRKKDDPTVRRGASVKAMAVCSQYHFVEIFRALLIISLDEYYQSQDSQVLVNLYETLNAVNMAEVPYPHPWTRRLMRRGASGSYTGAIPAEHLPEKWMYTIFFPLTGSQRIQVPIPLFSFPDETLTSSIALLFDVFGISIMRIYNALLIGARILFVGYNHVAGDVCKFVLAACTMIAPPCYGIINKAFPYANLSDLSFLEVEGYIAGVTNPVFESHPEWWDVMCQLDLPNGTGTIFTAEEASVLEDARSNRNSSLRHLSQRVFVDNLFHSEDEAFSTKLMAGINAGMNEQWVRSMLFDYTSSLFELAVNAIEIPDKVSDRVRTNGWRLKGLKTTHPTTLLSAQDPWRQMNQKDGDVGGSNLRYYLSWLRSEGVMDGEEVLAVFEAFENRLQSEASLHVLVGLLPESLGGLIPLCNGLLHGDKRVRKATLKLMERLTTFDSTRPAVLAVNLFFTMAMSSLANKGEV